MKVVLSLEAAQRLEAQVTYLRDAGAEMAAERLRVRVMEFLSNHIARYPSAGRRLNDRDLWEMWIPRTRLVVWYRIGNKRIEVATWHASQDRSVGEP